MAALQIPHAVFCWRRALKDEASGNWCTYHIRCMIFNWVHTGKMQWCGRSQGGLVLFISTNVFEEKKFKWRELFLAVNSDLNICKNLLLICKPSTLCCLTVWNVPMGTFFSITAMKQFCLAAWKRHPSCLGMCGELICQRQCWPTLLEGDSAISVTGQDRGGCGSKKEKSFVPGTQKYFMRGVSFKK